MWYANQKKKNIAWAQPNLNLPVYNHCNKVNTHLKCMKHCYNANEMQCMMIYNHLHKTHPKNFTKTSSILKNLKKISNTQNLDLNAWNVWRMSERKIIPSDLRQEKAENHVGWRFWERREYLEGEKIDSVDRDQGEMKKNRAKPLYRKVINLDKSRGVEIKNMCFIYRRAVQHLLRGVYS